MNILQHLDRVAEASRDYCDRRKVWLLCGFSIPYLLSTGLLASQKPMWNDELFTYYISRLPTVSDIWSALLTGGEQIPPFFHIITRISLFLFGVNELAIRLPEIIGFWVMSLCLFRFVSKRSSALYGFVAMLFPFVTKAYYYAYEARPYAIVLGLAGLSLVCWQTAAEGHYRKLSLIGLAVSLAAAVSSHYYAVLLYLPLFIGEAARTISRGRLDLPIWLASAAGITPLLLFFPLIQKAKGQAATFWAQPHWGNMTDFYYSLLSPALLPLVAMIVLAAIYSTFYAESDNSRSKGTSSTLRPYEIAAAFGFIAIPVAGVILAKLFTGAVISRYVLPAVIGFSIFVPFAAHRLADGRPIIGTALVLFLSSGFVVAQVRNFQSVITASSNQAKNYDFLRMNNKKELPVVASDLHTFMTLAHYAPRDIASRVVYLADPRASLRHLGHSSIDQGILDLKPWFKLRIEKYSSFVDSQKRFFVYGNMGWLNWLVSELVATNKQVELKGRNRENFLFLVSNR